MNDAAKFSISGRNEKCYHATANKIGNFSKKTHVTSALGFFQRTK